MEYVLTMPQCSSLGEHVSLQAVAAGFGSLPIHHVDGLLRVGHVMLHAGGPGYDHHSFLIRSNRICNARRDWYLITFALFLKISILHLQIQRIYNLG